MSESDKSMPKELPITLESMKRGSSRPDAGENLWVFRWVVEEDALDRIIAARPSREARTAQLARTKSLDS